MTKLKHYTTDNTRIKEVYQESIYTCKSFIGVYLSISCDILSIHFYCLDLQLYKRVAGRIVHIGTFYSRSISVTQIGGVHSIQS